MLFSDKYFEIENDTESVYKEKGSKFLAYVFLLRDEVKIKQSLAYLRNVYPDASHHCYAWVLGHDQQNFRTNDDGEPGNTAGKPILRQIKKLNLTNVLVVVVRYFGGTLLGVPGLIEAYGQAAGDCLNKCKIIEKTVFERYELCCEYGLENEVYKLGKQYNTAIIVKHTENRFCAEIKIPLLQTETFKQQLKLLYHLNYQSIGIA
jgi:uncharacterized YigZ family protein